MVSIAAMELSLHFQKGETIHTENSYKFSEESIRRLLRGSCFETKRTWMDVNGWYAVTLARPHDRAEHP
jgi:L-histidine N-alpha-methyltransferase